MTLAYALFWLAASYLEDGVPTNELYPYIRPMPKFECQKVIDAKNITEKMLNSGKVWYCVPDGPPDELEV